MSTEIRIRGRRRGLRAAGGLMLVVTASSIAAAPAPASSEDTWAYRVVPGDTLIGISKRFLLRPGEWPALQRLNGVANPRHLQPASVVRIPLAWMATAPTVAEVVFTRGPATVGTDDASAAGRPVAGGDLLRASEVVRTGADGSVTLRLADGSRVLVAPGSALRIDRLLGVGREAIPAARLGLDHGDAEVRVTPAHAERSFEIHTPAVNLGVRGTRFRAHAGGAVDAGEAASAPSSAAASGTAPGIASSRVEVLEGRVAAEAGGAQVLVDAGQGAVAADGRLAPPRALVARPDVAPPADPIERVPLRFTWPPLAGAQSWRAQVFELDAPDHLLLDGRFAQPVAQWADLPDGRYELVVRGVDDQRLEGQDARVAFRLKARPEPPFTLKPRAGATAWGEHADLAWARVVAASHYRLQVAASADFAQPVVDEARLADTTRSVDLAPGAWFWRVASVATRPDGSDDPGPWGDAQPFTQRPVPPVPAIEPPHTDAAGVHLQWKRPEAGEHVRVQVATDAAFSAIVLDRTTDEDGTLLPTPSPGTYFVRARTIAADGFEGAFGGAQQVDVPRPPGLWWLLLPALAWLLSA